MSKKFQVLLPETEYREIAENSTMRDMTIGAGIGKIL
jgi:hypothetical protein